ncbi:hypothetical protein [Methylocella silvestris]|uniref:Uncharacterized protein n=1 Tax=Methylocella silvestris TaxID=199596 RepID=A0A2J7TDC2_METSI|nr:hypothetical protein [Methylocella silvestris]PNG24775.1 hypothetical protein CR492_16865 [Methylocella silvestris]
MNADWLLGRRRFEAPCAIEIEHSFDSLHAHVTLDSDAIIGPGAEVIVHGEAIEAPFGSRLVLRRRATIVQPGWFDRIATRIKSQFELTELFDVSFSSWRAL